MIGSSLIPKPHVCCVRFFLLKTSMTTLSCVVKSTDPFIYWVFRGFLMVQSPYDVGSKSEVGFSQKPQTSIN